MKKFRSKKIMILILTLILTFGILTGCNSTGKEEKLEDSNEKVERIVSLAPSNTEILFSLGLGDRIVGVTTECDYPKEAMEKDKVGDYKGINIEKVIELEPDLVIGYGEVDEGIASKIKEAGISLVSYEPESIDEIIDVIKKIGEVTGKEEEAKKVTEDMNAKKGKILDKIKDAEEVKVFYEVWNDPLMAAGPGSFMDELINLAGGENIAKDAKGEYPEFDQEQLIERNPDVYLTADDNEDKTVESIKIRPGYETMDAIKNDRIYLLEPNIVSRPGPRIIDALELVAEALYPELFE